MEKKTLYSATATVTGGRLEGRGRTGDGALDVVLRTPPELGGPGGGTNPEQLFAVGWAACFEASLFAATRLARPAEADISDAEIDATVDLVADGEGGFEIAARLAVTLPSVSDPELAAELVRSAHGLCPYSRATRGNIDVAFVVNGAELAEGPALAA
jgi:osmotically inducible protein OsmC